MINRIFSFTMFLFLLLSSDGIQAKSTIIKVEVLKENINFNGWENCIRLSNGSIELIVTTEIGPRIIKFGYINGQNFMYVDQDDKGKSGGDVWRLYGGHRLWISPEIFEKTYTPDNNKVNYFWDGETLKLSQNIDIVTGLIKEMNITMYPEKDQVTISHRIVNKNIWEVELSLWAITALAGGGKAIIPQEPYIKPEEYMLPSRPIVLWFYTQMEDPRFIWGNKYIQIKHDSDRSSEQKIGVLNKQKWSVYYKNNELLIKYFEYDSNATYPDYGCNNEVYVNAKFVEVETLGPLINVAPLASVEHIESWLLSRVTISDSDESIDKNVIPIVSSFFTLNH